MIRFLKSLNFRINLETKRREIDLRFKLRFDNKFNFIKSSTEANIDNDEEAEQYIRLQCLDVLRWLGYESYSGFRSYEVQS